MRYLGSVLLQEANVDESSSELLPHTSESPAQFEDYRPTIEVRNNNLAEPEREE